VPFTIAPYFATIARDGWTLLSAEQKYAALKPWLSRRGARVAKALRAWQIEASGASRHSRIKSAGGLSRATSD
jgi:hypothetical protein